MSDELPTKFIKAAKNEYVLLGYRAVVTALGIFISYAVTDLKAATSKVEGEVASIRRDISDDRVKSARDMAHLQGQVDGLQGSVDVHRRRLEGNDNDIRSIWARLYDVLKSPRSDSK